MLEQWKIHKAQASCQKPGCTLASDREYFSVLELPACIRQDLCATCFHSLQQEAQGDPIYWRAIRQEKAQDGPRLDLNSLRFLFDRLGEEDSEAAETAAGLRYFVALLLLRKRVLRMVDAQTREQEVADLLVIDPKIEGMEPVALQAPSEEAGDLGQIRQELLALLEGEGAVEG
ncbi:MAG: hypothetical protein ACYTG5_01035 [Planctomycetota bacterium]|jgi:hypothetical protein